MQSRWDRGSPSSGAGLLVAEAGVHMVVIVSISSKCDICNKCYNIRRNVLGLWGRSE